MRASARRACLHRYGDGASPLPSARGAAGRRASAGVQRPRFARGLSGLRIHLRKSFARPTSWPGVQNLTTYEGTSPRHHRHGGYPRGRVRLLAFDHRLRAWKRRRGEGHAWWPAGCLHPRRPALVQPPRRARADRGAAQPPHAGTARSNQSRDVRARAVAGGEVGSVARRPDLHGAPSPGRHVVRRRAVHVRRRPLHAAGGLRPENRKRRHRAVDGRRQADHRDGARRPHGCPFLCGALRSGAAPVRCAGHPAEAQARRAVERRDVRQRLELGDAAGGDRRDRAVPAARVRPRPTACPRPQPSLLAQGG